jgi:hypothetical protein
MSAGWCGMSVAVGHRSGNGGLVRGNRALVRTISLPSKTYERTPANDKTVRLSLQIQKTAKDSKIYLNLGRYGTKEGTVSGSITWECASVQRL